MMCKECGIAEDKHVWLEPTVLSCLEDRGFVAGKCSGQTAVYKEDMDALGMDIPKGTMYWVNCLDSLELTREVLRICGAWERFTKASSAKIH